MVTKKPPARLSVRDKDFDSSWHGHLKVFVDGAEQEEVIEYDCDAGTALIYYPKGSGRTKLLKGAIIVEYAPQ